MKQTILICGILIYESVLWSTPNPFAAGVRSTDPLTPEKEAKSFQLAPGFSIQLFASEPQINKPMNMAFDTRGRLWVTSTVEYPYPVKPGIKGRDTLKILEDTNGDGRADKVTTFADGLNIPTGVYPYKDGAIVWSIPNIWLLRDTNGDGRADKREVLYGPLGFERDTHGMNSSFTRGFDDWLHITHGFNNYTTVRALDGSSINMQSGNTYRVRVDGSRVEQFTWGQVNPFGMCIDSRGNFYTADCHSSPIYQLIPSAYYPSFGKPHDGLGYAPRVILHSHGSTAICGILVYDDHLWPKDYLGNIFVGNVMTSRVNRDTIQLDGSSPNGTEATDFIKTTDPWFRPVDLQLGPDGALYIADFYNRIIGHYEVPLNHPGRDRTRGRIWRVTYQGKSHPKLNLTTPAKAVAELSGPNLTRRHLALAHIVDTHKQQAVPLLKEQSNNHLAAWALYRLGKLTEKELAALAISKEPLAQIHAMRIFNTISSWTPAQRNMVLNALETTNPHVKRAAAEALARHPNAANIKPIIDATEKFLRFDSLQVKGKREADDHLIHTLRITLRNQLLAPGAFAAIDKLQGNNHHELLKSAALGVATTDAGDYLIDQLPTHKGDPSTIIRHSARHASGKGMATLTPMIEKRFSAQPATQASLFMTVQEGVRQRGGKLTVGTYNWGSRLAARLLSKGKDDKIRKSGAEIARDLKLAHVTGPLRELADKSTATPEARAAAMDALGVILNVREFAPLVGRILGNPDTPIFLKEKTMRASITHTALHPLLGENLAAAPATLQIRYARLLSGQGASTLITTIAAGKAPATLLLDFQVKENLPSILKDRAAQLTQGVQLAKPETAKLITEQLTNFQEKSGDPARGLQVFKSSCAACHQKNGVGGNIGPQLDGIASRGVERVIEDILDPNRNVDIAFRYSIVKLKDGQTLVGLKRRVIGKAIVFADLMGKETTIPKVNIVNQNRTNRSLMPANLGEILPPTDFNALLAYLLKE